MLSILISNFKKINVWHIVTNCPNKIGKVFLDILDLSPNNLTTCKKFGDNHLIMHCHDAWRMEIVYFHFIYS